MNGYRDFTQLREHEREGIDYVILHRRGTSGILVMAPHGGGIEPGTADIADAVAGREHAFYGFKGIKPGGNRILHISSNRFEEPLAVRMLETARRVVTIHGCREEAPLAWIGGRDRAGGEGIIARLQEAGFPARRCERAGLRGLQPNNLCNRGLSGTGVQLELSMGLRRMLFSDLGKRRLRLPTPLFHPFVQALQEALAKP